MSSYSRKPTSPLLSRPKPLPNMIRRDIATLPSKVPPSKSLPFSSKPSPPPYSQHNQASPRTSAYRQRSNSVPSPLRQPDHTQSNDYHRKLPQIPNKSTQSSFVQLWSTPKETLVANLSPPSSSWNISHSLSNSSSPSPSHTPPSLNPPSRNSPSYSHERYKVGGSNTSSRPILTSKLSQSALTNKSSYSTLSNLILTDHVSTNNPTGTKSLLSNMENLKLTTTDSYSSHKESIVLDMNGHPVGLRNLGNTCYMNSVLQCLSHTYPLTTYFLTVSMDNLKCNRAKAYKKFIEKMWQTRSVFHDASDLRSKFCSRNYSFMSSGQQDAQEFLDFFLSKFHDVTNESTKKLTSTENLSSSGSDPNVLADKAWKSTLAIDHSPISDLFMGQLRSSLTCLKCKNTTYTFEPFWSLSLPFPPSKSTSGVTLDDCLNMFTREERLVGNNRPLCSKCSSQQDSTKTLKVQRFPKILVLHLKRFSYINSYRNSKLADPVRILKHIDITQARADTSQPVSYKFSLYSFIDHFGTSHAGHYIATCKHLTTGNWYKLNDSLVSQVDGANIDRGLPSKNVYILFYQRESKECKDYLCPVTERELYYLPDIVT